MTRELALFRLEKALHSDPAQTSADQAAGMPEFASVTLNMSRGGEGGTRGSWNGEFDGWEYVERRSRPGWSDGVA